MKIDSILPNRVSPGQSVIIQGDGLGDSETVLLGGDEVPFEIDGETLVVPIPDLSGEIDVTVRGGSGENDTSRITIE